MKTSSGYSIRAILFGLALSVPYATAATVTIDATTTADANYSSMEYRGGGTVRGTIYTLANGAACNNHLILDNGGTDAFKKQLAAAAQDGGSGLLLSDNSVDIKAGAAVNTANNKNHVINGAYLQNASGSVSNNSVSACDYLNATQIIGGHIYMAQGDAEQNVISGNRVTVDLSGANQTDANGNVRALSTVLLAGFLTEYLPSKDTMPVTSGILRNNIVIFNGGQYLGSNIRGAEHQGLYGIVEGNQVIMTNCNTGYADDFFDYWGKDGKVNRDTPIVSGGYNDKGHVDILNNSVTLINSKVHEVRAGNITKAAGGNAVNGNTAVIRDSVLYDVRGASLSSSGKEFRDVSDNEVILEGSTIVRNDASGLFISSTSSKSVVKNASGNKVIMRDEANVRGSLAGYQFAYDDTTGKYGSVEQAYDNALIIEESWTGSSLTRNTLNNVQNFDKLQIDWTGEQTLTINKLTLSPNAADEDFTIVLNDVGTTLLVNSLTNEADKPLNVEATGNARDQMGEGSELTQNLEKLGRALRVRNAENGYTPEYASTVTTEEGQLYGAVTAQLDGEGKVIGNSVVQQENTVVASLGNIAGVQYLAYRSQLNDLQNRLSALRAMPAGKNNAFWARAFGGKDKYTALGSDYHYSGAQVGADRRFGRYLAGLAFGYTDARTSRINGRADDTQYSLGAYGSWQGRKGQFVDLVAKHTRMSSDHELYATNGERSTGEQDNWGCSISAEYGWHITLPGSGFYLEPRAGLMYAYLDDVSFTTSRGVRVDQSDAEAIIGRLGLTAGYVFADNKASVYARADVLHDWGGDTSLTMNHDTAARRISHNLSETFGEFALGGTVGVADNCYIFSEVQMRTGEHIDQPWHINVGVSVGF